MAQFYYAHGQNDNWTQQKQNSKHLRCLNKINLCQRWAIILEKYWRSATLMTFPGYGDLGLIKLFFIWTVSKVADSFYTL